MSRVAKNPITLPKGINAQLMGQEVTVKGSKGALQHNTHPLVEVIIAENVVNIKPRNETTEADALAGSTRAILANMVHGVHEGFEKKLELMGVGYRAQVQGHKLNLTLGFSHPVAFDIPKGITIETPSQTEIIIKGLDKQLVGQVAAKIRAYRSPEPYKGKGVRYSGERIKLKETKKK